MPKASTLVVVADGGTARFFTWPKRGAGLSECDDLRMEVPPSPGERGPAPRTQDSAGSQRHKIERRRTAHEANEERFLVSVAERTNSVMEKLSATALILFAPPRALGLLRATLAGDERRYELLTIDKDLTKETPDQLDQRVRAVRPFPHTST
jgi:protein required for attachment to host cells